MSAVLLDTNIVSYIYKRDSRALLYEKHIVNREICISLVTVAELFLWARIRNWGSHRLINLEDTVKKYTILPVEFETCHIWANIRKERSDRGMPISPNDAWIAAAAVQYQIPLVTHNPNDFQRIQDLVLVTEVAEP